MAKLMGKYLLLFAAPLSYNKCYSHAGWSFRDIQLFFCVETVEYSSIIYQQVFFIFSKENQKSRCAGVRVRDAQELE